jgi:hypothetical protein
MLSVEELLVGDRDKEGDKSPVNVSWAPESYWAWSRAIFIFWSVMKVPFLTTLFWNEFVACYQYCFDWYWEKVAKFAMGSTVAVQGRTRWWHEMRLSKTFQPPS